MGAHCIRNDSLDELVKDGVNGLVFKNAQQLATQIEVCMFIHLTARVLNTPLA